MTQGLLVNPRRVWACPKKWSRAAWLWSQVTVPGGWRGSKSACGRELGKAVQLPWELNRDFSFPLVNFSPTELKPCNLTFCSSTLVSSAVCLSGCTYIEGNATSGFSSYFSFLLFFGARYLLLVGGSGSGPGWGTGTQLILELITVNRCCALQVVNKPASHSNCLAPWVQRGGWVMGLRLCYLQITREDAVKVWKLLLALCLLLQRFRAVLPSWQLQCPDAKLNNNIHIFW